MNESDRGWFRQRAVIALAGPRAVRLLSRSKGPRYRTTIHEAAHVAIARALGVHVAEVSVIPQYAGGKRVTEGHTLLAEHSAETPRPSRIPPPDSRLVRLALVCCAPPGADWRSYLRLWREIQAETDRLVADNWPAIQAVAHRLLWDGRIGPGEVEAVMTQAHQN